MGFFEHIVKITLNTQFYLEKALDRDSFCKKLLVFVLKTTENTISWVVEILHNFLPRLSTDCV